MSILNWLNANPGVTSLLQFAASLVLVFVTGRYVRLTRRMANAADRQLRQRERELQHERTPRITVGAITAWPRLTNVAISAGKPFGLDLDDNEIYKLANLSDGTIWIVACNASATDRDGHNVDVQAHAPSNLLLKSGSVIELNPRLFAAIRPDPNRTSVFHRDYYVEIQLVLLYKFSRSGRNHAEIIEITQPADGSAVDVYQQASDILGWTF